MLYFKSGFLTDFFFGTSAIDQKAGAKVLLFFYIAKYFCTFFCIYREKVVLLQSKTK